jgi:hypothetical protein
VVAESWPPPPLQERATVRATAVMTRRERTGDAGVWDAHETAARQSAFHGAAR